MNQPKHPHAPTPAAPKATPAQHQQDALDEALEESFPSSDPVAISVTRDAPPAPPKR